MVRTCAAAFLLLLSFWTAAARADGATPATREGILAWQQRLTDAGCYHGGLDGVASAEFDEAVKACPDMRPYLSIETGMHVATIWRVGVNADCTRLATSSEDKTVRIWSLPEGRLEQTVRLPIGGGDNGKIFATALTADGRMLAAGGADPYSGTTGLYVVDLSNGSVRRFGELPSRIFSVAFSPNGARVAVGMSYQGVRIFDVASGRQVMADAEYNGGVLGLAYGRDGALFTTSLDGFVRRYGDDGRLQAKSSEFQGKKAFSIALRPDGARLAVGFNGEARVAFLDARTLKAVAAGDTRGVEDGDLSAVAWSNDGAVLAAAGEGSKTVAGVTRRFIRRLSAEGAMRGPDANASLNTIQDLRACGRGFVFVSSEPSFGLMSADGGVRVLQSPHVADMRNKKVGGFTVSADGTRIRFGLDLGESNPVLFDLLASTLNSATTAPVGLNAARVTGLPVMNWDINYAPTFAGAKIALDNYERSNGLAMRRDGKGFALGTNYYVRSFDAAGHEQWKQPGPGVAWGANTADNDRLLLIAYGDGTIRWLRGDNGAELLALFVEPQTRRWVAWTPSGYYMASAGGEDLIGWRLNRGWSQLNDFFPASHFQGFNRPDVVQLVLTTRDEAEAVRQANEKIRGRPAQAPETALPPVVTIASAGDNGRFGGETVDVTFEVRSPSGAPISRVEALIDGVRIDARGLAPAVAQPQGDMRRLTVAAPPRDFELALIAYAGAQASEPAKTRLSWAGGAKSVPDLLKPTLYVATIGVSDYVKDDLRLTYANADARGFAEAIRAQAGGLYADVKVLPPLVDRAVTRASVIGALRWLRKQATSRDIAMVLIAGHGVTDDGGNYYFLPSDATPEDLDSAGVSQDDILREMRQIAGKAILFLDTCHANQAVASGVARRGATNIDSVVNEFSRAENGLVVFSASRGRETSRESAQWRHGAFTQALIEGLAEGKADLLRHGAVTLSELDAFLADRVKTLTDGEQHPVMTRPPTMPDFPFATSRR